MDWKLKSEKHGGHFTHLEGGNWYEQERINSKGIGKVNWTGLGNQLREGKEDEGNKDK